MRIRNRYPFCWILAAACIASPLFLGVPVEAQESTIRQWQYVSAANGQGCELAVNYRTNPEWQEEVLALPEASECTT